MMTKLFVCLFIIFLLIGPDPFFNISGSAHVVFESYIKKTFPICHESKMAAVFLASYLNYTCARKITNF